MELTLLGGKPPSRQSWKHGLKKKDSCKIDKQDSKSKWSKYRTGFSICGNKPGNGGPRGGEFPAEDCWLDEYHDDIVVRPSYCIFVGDVVPEAEYLLGDTLVEIVFGVAVGVTRVLIYGVTENRWPARLEAVNERKYIRGHLALCIESDYLI